jgi:hypothetical protein
MRTRQRNHHRLLIDNPQVERFTAFTGQAHKSDIQLRFAKRPHQRPYCPRPDATSPRVTVLKLLQQAKDLRMKSIRTGNAQREAAVHPAGDPLGLFQRRVA